MRKNIPFLFGLVVVLCASVAIFYRTELSSGQTNTMIMDELVEDEEGAVASVSLRAENAFGGDLVNFATRTSGNMGQVSTSTIPVSGDGFRDVRGATTSAPIAELVKVQPGFGGGGAPAEQSPLVQLPEYKEEQEKVEPKIEFEYCE